MTHIKRNWKLFIVTFAVVALSAGAWWLAESGSIASAQSQPPNSYTPVADSDRDALLALLDEADLDHETLVALNLSSEQAVAILAACRTWVESNAATRTALQNTLCRKRAALRGLEKQARMGQGGPGVEQEIAAARAELAAARRAVQAQASSLRALVSASLSPSQVSTWSAIRRGWGQDMPIAMVALTGPQRHAYGKALRHYKLRLAAAGDREEYAAAQALWQQDAARILTADNQQVIGNYNTYAEQAEQNVNQAYETVLPNNGGQA